MGGKERTGPCLDGSHLCQWHQSPVTDWCASTVPPGSACKVERDQISPRHCWSHENSKMHGPATQKQAKEQHWGWVFNCVLVGWWLSRHGTNLRSQHESSYGTATKGGVQTIQQSSIGGQNPTKTFLERQRESHISASCLPVQVLGWRTMIQARTAQGLCCAALNAEPHSVAGFDATIAGTGPEQSGCRVTTPA